MEAQERLAFGYRVTVDDCIVDGGGHNSSRSNIVQLSSASVEIVAVY